MWFGFDNGGQSLGVNLTGATLAGHAWGDYFRKIHENLIPKPFPQPLTGVIEATVCSTSGMILTDACGDHQTTQWFIEGTQPTELCPTHSNQTGSIIGIARLEKEMIKSGLRSTFEYDTTPLTLNFDFLQAVYIFEEEEKTDLENIEEEPQTSFVDNTKDYDYNYLME